MKNKYLLIAAGLLLGLASCEKKPHFTVEGTITGADEKMLYLEAAEVTTVTPLDSVKLKKGGSFKLEGPRTQYPEFYRLRIDGIIINLAIDSTETVGVKADYKDMPVNYELTQASETNQKIKELAVKQVDLQSRIDQVYQNRNLAPYQMEDSVANMVTRYKNDIKSNYIYKAPNTLYSYFALFQRVNNYMLFDTNNAEDVKCFAAVATSFDNLYPHSVRATNLHSIALRGMRSTRQQAVKTISLPTDKVKEAGLIDIALKDENGRVRHLTDLKGKVVLLDFTLYAAQSSAERNMMLRKLYDKYKNDGLEIYQISYDTNVHYWQTSSDHLPWICVRDPQGTASNLLQLYNVQNLPTYFLINRDNELKVRQETVKDLDAEIKKLL